MSESPARFQAAPAPSAEIRSLAIAKLKRAASLPRTPDGRRQPQTRAAGGPSAAASEDSHGATCSFEPGMTHSSIKGATQYGGDEELLAASSSPAIFGGGSAMKRSNSESSSLHIPTPYGSANASPFFTAQASPASNPGTDWAAYQLAQSYLPSISPAPPSNPTAPPSSFPANLTPGAAGAGRNTPSPLPSLGELRNLSRSNSAAARQNAMNKLIGGAATPTKTRNVGAMLSSSEEDVTLSLPGSVRQLHRSGTIGVPRMFGMPAETVVDDTTITPIPDTAYDVPRPRLQRSFTVSSSNMGEERRSAVGRRMVERLGARRAARQQEETEVRQLWEERRRTRGSQKGLDISTPDGTPPRPAAAPPTTASAKPPPTAFAAAVGAGGVAALLGNVGSDRTASRNTQHSDNVFEYEDHLKRSMSTRTARTEAMGESPASESRPAFDDMGDVGGDHGVDDPTPLPIPELPVTTPTKHVPTESVSSSDTTVMGKVPSPAISDLERVSSAQSAVPFNSYHSSQQGCSMYDSEGEEQLNGDDWDSHATNFSRQISRTDTHSVMDTNAGHHGHVDADSAHSSDDIRPVSKVSEPGPSNNGHVDTSEPREHKKSSSISRLMGRAMFTAVKPRISAASNDTPPLSPREGAVHSRRQSDASNSQSQHSMHSQYSHREIPSFMTNRRRAPPPPIELTESNVVSINDDPVTPPSSKFSQLPPRSRDVLCRMDGVLSLPVNSPSRPDFLDDPPRKLLRSQQVLQVVNMNTVKDRYLFLFNDLLVIAKPIMGSGTTTANLDMKFVVKSIVGLDKLVVSGLDDEPTTDPARHPAVQQFIHDFAEDAVSAVRKLVERNNPLHDMATLANLLFTTVDLDKTQLGLLLASDPELLSAYLKMFDFNLVRIDEALRLFLLDVRLPTEIHAAEAVLRGFADGYITANESSVTFDMGLAEDLVLSTLELNDMLYSTFGFAFPNHAISRDTFIAAFESKDPLGLVPIELLRDIYTSIRGSKLIQGLSTHESHHVREVFQTPSQLPSKLTYHEWSDRFQLSIPKPDPHFQIKLAATGLELDPPVLDFSQTKDVSFRVRGTKLGWQTMLFERFGANAALYPTLGNSRSFLVERAFMRSTFCVAFPHHLGGKRKYCFSVPEASLRTKWGAALSRQTWLASTKKQQQTSGPVSKTAEGRTHRAAEAVALQVLRDALLPNEDKGEEVNRSPRSNAASSILARVLRHGSISAAYPKQAPDEADLPLLPTRGHSSATPGLVELRTGKELVLLCRQNSLLPAVLELLQKGAGTEKPAGDNVAKGPPQQQQQQKPANLPPSPPTQNPPRAAHLQAAQQPKKSAGLRAMMHDRRL
ncbi:hypothetical protein CspeluHIS016_0405620 [Cutaneotrichosporon spelunceum]|uniref:SEC7 domain-containing protein n=1 Tax=Cutaneotrichosporon spelunceum TaxID=1672016 RepID=A0AAD3YD20_9TREE|nr:hypothetical protein CspeluHIS016_0405620 [Cutaneotrichosporon spelunceum]